MKEVKQFFVIVFAIILFTASLSFSQSPVPSGAKVEQIATGFQQPEGPVWMDGVGLLFSDIKAAKIYKWTPENGKQVYIEHSDSSNGLTLDKNGKLILTQMGKRRVARQESDGTITVLASTYNGKKFNCPNDVVVKSDGSIFFTDPDFNLPTGAKTEILVNGKYVKGVYRVKPTGDVQLLDATFDKPNGICFSPDEKKLYVNESPKGEIYVWDVVNDSTITNKKLFNKVTPYADGMKVDTAGNLYCTGSGGVWIFSPDGKYLDKISVAGSPSNCAWGDADRKTLYMTGGSSVYKIRLAPTSGVEGQGSILPKNFELFQNYPNPFNPSTNISYQLPTDSHVSIKIYDTLGREMATLVDEFKPAGTYNSKFSIRNSQFPTGVYFCRFSADGFVQTKKMLLMK